MAFRMIGLEIGSTTVKMVVCSGGSIKKMAMKRMPEEMVRDGKPISPESLAGFLKDMRKEFGIPSGACSMVIPQQFVISHHISMPVINDEELRLNIPYEFRDFVGKDSAKYDYDYSVMGVKDGMMNLYAAAVRRDMVEAYYDILKKAGLKLVIAIPAEMALTNLVNQNPGLPSPLCIVDFGQNYTHVSIFSEGNYVMGKNIEVGGYLIDQTISSDQKVDAFVARNLKEDNTNKVLSNDALVDAYQTIAFEVMKVVNFYSYSSAESGEQLENMYYCGTNSVIEPLRTALVKATGMTLHHITHLVPGGLLNDMTLSCVLAAGAAIQTQK